ncbi:hypothetical protein HDU67_002676, partial [Dinochytrium kinnereticum]
MTARIDIVPLSDFHDHLKRRATVGVSVSVENDLRSQRTHRGYWSGSEGWKKDGEDDEEGYMVKEEGT